jgi:toxin YoeB
MKRALLFSSGAWEDYLHWQATDRTVLRRIHLLIQDIQRSPYEGIGKPEALKHQLSGWFSRRINSEHRLVYRVTESSIEIAALRHHY